MIDLITALVYSRLDYCNVVFAGLPACGIQRLQSVLNTAVRLVAGSSRRDHAFSLLRDCHWLPVKQRVEYILYMMVHRCMYGDIPSYLLDLITCLLMQPSEVVSDQLHPAQSQCHNVIARRPVIRCGWPPRMEQTATTTSSRSFCCCF